MELVTDPTRRSRVRRQSAGKDLAISPRDLAIFKLLDRYRYLPSNFIHAFVGGNLIRFKQRLGELFHEGYLDRPYRQWQAMNARYRPAVYELDRKAQEVLAEHQIEGSHRIGVGGTFAHELMVCEVIASLELAVQSDPALRFVDGRTLLARAPEATRHSPTPFAIPLEFWHDGARVAFDLKPDGRPFALSASLTDGRSRSLYFPGIEIDRHTEPLHASEIERSSILKKILAYREMVAAETYKTRLGFPNMLVPIITVSHTHMENMLSLVLSLTKGKGASYLLFKSIPDFASLEKTVAPDLSLLRAPWQRAGHPPFDIVRELQRGPQG